jgi:hypothetical protein
VQVGDLVTWAWQLQADSWKSTRFKGIILRMDEVSNGTVLRVLDNTGQQVRVRTDAPCMEVISERR